MRLQGYQRAVPTLFRDKQPLAGTRAPATSASRPHGARRPASAVGPLRSRAARVAAKGGVRLALPKFRLLAEHALGVSNALKATELPGFHGLHGRFGRLDGLGWLGWQPGSSIARGGAGGGDGRGLGANLALGQILLRHPLHHHSGLLLKFMHCAVGGPTITPSPQRKKGRTANEKPYEVKPRAFLSAMLNRGTWMADREL